MNHHLTVRMKAYIQPFERELALQEIRALAGNSPVAVADNANAQTSFLLESTRRAADLAQKLAYWELVAEGTDSIITTQSLRESTVNLVRNGIALDVLRAQLPFAKTVPLPNRRCLRYGTHGIHEYRGKFFPQLVRSLLNIASVERNAIVADPMSGSGTTAAESVLAGCYGRGLDLNPLSVFLAEAKCSLLSADASRLALDYEILRADLSSVEPNASTDLPYFARLPVEDQKYLRAWFSDDVLAGLDDIACAIERLGSHHSRTLARVALSNIVRAVSWQKDDDLRVRKEIRLDIEIDPKKEFLEELGRSVRAVLAFLYQNGPSPEQSYEIIEGDARHCGQIWGENSVDVVITSPPYATALPYLDTDRLSLCYLGLLPRPEHRSRDQRMIGNREVTERQRRDHWAHYKNEGAVLPESVRNLVDRVHELNDRTEVGFRRKNLPALLARYFFDMRAVLVGIQTVLKPGSLAFVVVGNNHTIAGGQHVDIETAKLLRELGRSVGLEAAESLSMDMLISRDIFRKNAMASEEILAFRKPR